MGCLDITRMIEYAERYGLTFAEVFMHTISHELIHQIITDVETDDASDKLENICIEKYEKMKYWIGGIGATKEGGKDDF